METGSVWSETTEFEVLDPENFQEAVKAQLEVSKRLHVSCAMLLLRLEYEELYVERYELKKGATTLRDEMARLIATSVRQSDTLGWFEEGTLGVLLRVISAEETSLIASRLQKILAQQPLLVGHYNLHLAAQVGGVWYSGKRPMDQEDFTSQALRAMQS